MTSPMPMLEVTDLSVDYRRGRDGQPLRAVESLNVCIDTGTFVTVVGPSGCGKSTLLKVVDEQVPISTGSVLLNGRSLDEAQKDCAMVFQEALLLPWFSVLKNVAYGLECRKTDRAKARATASKYLSLVGLAEFEGHYP